MVRKIRESKALNEGPGAGYTIKGTIENVKVNQFVITGYDKDKYNTYAVIKLDASADFNKVSVESYYYGGEIDSTPIHISMVHLEVEEGEELSAEDIATMVEDTKIDVILGGGWSHSTFDGEIITDYKGIEDSYYVSFIGFELTDKGAVEYLDRAAIDGYREPQLEVVYSDNQGTETLEVFGEDEEDEAIAWAKENGGNAVIKVNEVYKYTKRDGLVLWDVDDYETIWEDENNPIIQDESLKESYVEVDTIVDGNGKEYRVVGGGFKSTDALVPVEDEDGNKTRMSAGDVAEFYTWKDSKGKVIHEPSEEEDEEVDESKEEENTPNECEEGTCMKKSLKEEVNSMVYDIADEIAEIIEEQGMMPLEEVNEHIHELVQKYSGDEFMVDDDFTLDVYSALNYNGIGQNMSTGDFYTDEYAKEHPEVLEESKKEDGKEELTESRKLTESYYADVFQDLIDRAEGWIDDGYDPDDAVHRALDDGLIYTDDIIALGQHYGVIDDGQVINDMYEALFDDIYAEVSDYSKDEEDDEEDEDEEETDESLNEEKEVEVDDDFTEEELRKYHDK